MKKIITLVLLITFVIAGCDSSKDSKEEAKKDNYRGMAANETITADLSKVKTELSYDEEAWKKEPLYGKEITIGYNGGLCTSTPALAAVKGFFEEEGLSVKVINVQSEKESVGTDKVQIATGHIASYLVPTIKGIDMVFISGAHTGCKSLYTLKNSKFNSTKDLIGHKIGLPNGIGNSDHNISLRFLNHDNIEPEKVKFVPVENSASVLALQKGEIQAALLSDQFAQKFVDDGTLQMIRSITFDADFKDETCCIHAFSGKFLRENPITALKATKAIKKCAFWIEDNKEEAVKLLYDNNWASGDVALANYIMSTYNFKLQDSTTENTLKNVIADYIKFGIIDVPDETPEQLLKRVWKPIAADFDPDKK